MLFIKRFKITRRRWNTILIVAITLFILVMASPQLIKQYLIAPSVVDPEAAVLNPYQAPIELNYNGVQFYFDDQWLAIPASLSEQAEQIVSTWGEMRGTLVDDSLLQKLRPSMESPVTVEIWYQDIEEPQRVTAYNMQTFWLIQNYNSQWLAISLNDQQLILHNMNP
ncbi:hypothetical protein [Vibrio hippocampi]|uniref:50S ribosomal protein L33 n=1 Tax=Vibrio hippocampi TaxID=654686 RepID=A0ABM8ZDY9_9VIBR|nr:hypothetical protein [Vibrio hippocampi]CAH0524414.1 hypothetical protein VHP8226_00241 [Vibrio hippocampi]